MGNSTRYVPVVVVLPAETLAEVLDMLAGPIERLEADPALAALMERNGWTAQMLALGGVIKGAI